MTKNSSMQGTNESLKEFVCEGPHPFTWYHFILSTAFVYYTMAVLSMLFSKESRRLREISLLHDNLIVFLILPSLIERFGFTANSLTPVVIQISGHKFYQMDTCYFIVFLHSSLQASFLLAVTYTIYAEYILLSKINAINPRSIVNLRWLSLQVSAGVIVATLTLLMDNPNVKAPNDGCCLRSVSGWTFKKIVPIAFDISSIYASYILLRVSIDRFLKLFVSLCKRSFKK